MATAKEQIDYIVEQVEPFGRVRSKKMFGEYMIYVNDKPLLLVCDGTVYIKQLEALGELMKDQPVGIPYQGAKEHFILDIENFDLCRRVLPVLEDLTGFPKPRVRKKDDSVGI